MERIRRQLNDGRVARVIGGLKPRRGREKPSRPASTNSRPTEIGCAATAAENADRRSDPALWKAPASSSSGARSSGRGIAGRKRVPTFCSPPNAVSKTIAGPTSSSGEPVAPQPFDQRKWNAPSRELGKVQYFCRCKFVELPIRKLLKGWPMQRRTDVREATTDRPKGDWFSRTRDA